MSSTWMVESAVRALALAGAAGLLLKAFRIRDLRAQKFVWTLVLLGALLMPLIMRWHLFAVPANSVVIPQRLSMAHVHVPAAPPPRQFDPSSIYFVITGFLLLRIAVGLVMAARLWHRAVRAPFCSPAPVRISREVNSPVTIGSGVVLPACSEEWESCKLRMVLAHEMSHVRQKDFFLHCLANAHVAVFWFNPLAWWIRKKLMDLGEAISDEAALREAEDRASYASLLLEYAAQPRRVALGVAMARTGNLSRRIERILTETRLSGALTAKRIVFIAAGLTILIAATSCLSLQLTAQTDSPKSDEPWAIISGDSSSMNGSTKDIVAARRLQASGHDDYIWFKRNGKQYFIDDPAIVVKAKALFEPEEELGLRQAELGEKQAKLGEEQSRLGELQANAGVRVPNLDHELAHLEEQLKKLQAAQNKMITEDQLADVQAKIANVQSKLGEVQSEIGEKQSELGEQQSELGKKQSELGEEQSKLGEQQSRLAEEASRKLQDLIDEALRMGKAKPVQ